LPHHLQRGHKALIGNAGYRRYLRKTAAPKGQPAFEIDPGELAEAARFCRVTLEWKALLRDLDCLQQLRFRNHKADWLVRTNASPDLAAVFRRAGIAPPPATPPPKPAPKKARPPQA
jgi:hypothetical protein